MIRLGLIGSWNLKRRRTMTLIAIASFTIFATFSICAAMEQEDNRRSDDFDTIQHFFGYRN
jgi:hypothetical protein